MYYLRRSTHSCGVKDIKGLNTDGIFSAKKLLEWLFETNMYYYYGNNPSGWSSAGRSHFHFCYAWRKSKRTGLYGATGASKLTRFKEYVERRGLGSVVITKPNGNPVHNGNTIIQSMTFTPDNKAMCAYAAKHYPEKCRSWNNSEWLV